MAPSLVSEILEWSIDRPGWQRDALRRIFLHGELDSEDIAELVELIKAAHGLAEVPPADPLASEHLAIADSSAGPISLTGVTHHAGVNALASEQTIHFTPNLTIVFGNNAAGKSGYTRILKQACRSRYSERVIGNVLSGLAPATPHASIALRDADADEVFDWAPKASPSEKLAAVSIFDSHCVPIYLRDKTDVAFRPFGLDVFDKLSSACGSVRAAIDKERSLLSAAAPILPNFSAGTTAKKLIDGLTSLTSPDLVRSLAILTEDEEARLVELRKLRRDFDADDPKKLARDLMLRADRLETLATHLQNVVEIFATENLHALPPLRLAAVEARTRLAALRDSMVATDLLPGTGNAEWHRLWEAAQTYSAVAYPEHAFPHIGANSQCVLCQQDVAAEAVERFERFAEYVTSTATSDATAADMKVNAATHQILDLVLEPSTIRIAREDLALEDAEAANHVAPALSAAAGVQAELEAWWTGEGELPVAGVSPVNPDAIVRIVASIRSRAKELQSSSTGMTAEALGEVNELEARHKLSEHLAVVLDTIERKKRIAAYGQCLEDVATNAITKKSTELTKRLVTDTLRQTFENELKAIAFTHLDVEVQAAGGVKGSLFHRLVFTHAPSVLVTDVLSEGEARALSVAAFMTELSTAPNKSAIVFDDPVSSLDHIWRERIARRLVQEGKTRQVIVFTHDLLFLHYLIAQAAQQEVSVSHQYIVRHGEAGFCLPDLPWVAMGIKERIGVLKKRVQAAEKTSRTEPGKYETATRDVYGLLREAWEQGVGEVLLNSVVERYRPSIETNRARKLFDITEDDCETLEREMTECSRWIRGHDAPPADGTPLPDPAEVQTRVQALENWVAGIRKRR